MQLTSGKVRVRVVPLGGVYTYEEPKVLAERPAPSVRKPEPSQSRPWARFVPIESRTDLSPES
jgi:hypothetical protein